MIQIEFQNSPDLDLTGQHTYYKNSLGLGRNLGDLLIDDELFSPHIKLELNSKGLFAQPEREGLVYHVNSKRIGGRKVLKSGDILKIGATEIIIKNFFYDEAYKTSNLIKQNLNILIQNESPLLNIVDLIDQELKGVEK